MKVSIDRAGRVVVPKPLRDQLGFSTVRELEAEVVEGRLELSAPHEPVKIIEGANGPLVAATGTPLTDEQVRQTLEAVRARV
ncbi:MAG TPA: AbrB/MazE/SpoVT family DNA-binding domain-containing protein [Solirubrobacteraceae bacterium]|nr:AbrB/MazE/SpoVT family DNA-binding domain-containing protein [Solirubrobacteraceae bacterium]